MKRIVSITVAGLGALTTLAFAGSQDRASADTVTTAGSTQTAPLTRATSEPAVAIVSTPNGQTVVARCISIQSTSGAGSSPGGQASTVVLRGTSPESKVVMQTFPDGTLQFRTSDGAAPGLTVIRSDATASGGVSGQTVYLTGEEARTVDLGGLVPRARPQQDAPLAPRVEVEERDEDIGQVEMADLGDLAANEGPEGSGLSTLAELLAAHGIDQGELKACIEEAMANARAAIEVQEQDLRKFVDRARQSGREATEALREAQQRALEYARDARDHAVRARPIAPLARAEGGDGVLEARIDALERAARERGQDVGNGDRSLEERVAQLERAMGSEDPLSARAPEESHARGRADALRAERDAAGASRGRAFFPSTPAPARPGPLSGSVGAGPGSTWTTPNGPRAPVSPVAPVAPVAPSAPRSAVSPVAPAAPPDVGWVAPTAPQAMRPFGATRPRSATPSAEGRAELERALDELRSEASRLREEMNRLRTEIDRLPGQGR